MATRIPHCCFFLFLVVVVVLSVYLFFQYLDIERFGFSSSDVNVNEDVLCSYISLSCSETLQ